MKKYEKLGKGLKDILDEVNTDYETEDTKECAAIVQKLQELEQHIHELQSLWHNQKEAQEFFIEMQKNYLQDYIKLLRKTLDSPPRNKPKKYHKKEEIIEYFNLIRNDFKKKKDAILATANHFDISVKTVEKHIYNL